MNIRAIKTEKVTPGSIKLFELLDKYVAEFSEGSILAVTSKIVAICEGRVVPVEGSDKDELIKKEADFYIPKEENRYNLYLTIKNSLLAISAGIDESNAAGFYVFWPKDPQKTANEIREYLTERFKLKKVGVIITDSRTTPLRWGVTVIGIGYSGFHPLKDYVGTPDLFGRAFRFEKLSILDSLSTAAGVVMGEGNEQTPLSIITDIPFVEFQERNPTQKELDELKISIEDDVYGSILKRAPWRKGKK
jgi:putative folate metabolism gamma-glutamate ligase